MKNYSDVFATARKNSGLTQKELAEKSGIAQGDISKLEKGLKNPSLKTLEKIANALGMTLKLEFVPFLKNYDAT